MIVAAVIAERVKGFGFLIVYRVWREGEVKPRPTNEPTQSNVHLGLATARSVLAKGNDIRDGKTGGIFMRKKSTKITLQSKRQRKRGSKKTGGENGAKRKGLM